MEKIAISLIIDYYEIKSYIFWKSFALSKRIRLDLRIENLPIKIQTYINRPYQKEYLILPQSDIPTFINAINKLIPNETNEIIRRMELCLSLGKKVLQIYTEDLNQSLNPLLINRVYHSDIDDILKFYRTSKSPNSLESISFNPINSWDRLDISCINIGFTDQNLDKLSSGKELECEISFFDNDEVCKDYIFINHMFTITTRNRLNVIDFYIMPDDIIDQAKLEFTRLAEKYENVKKIATSTLIFDFREIKTYFGLSKFANEYLYELKKRGSEYSLNSNFHLEDCDCNIGRYLRSYILDYNAKSEIINKSILGSALKLARKMRSCSNYDSRPDYIEQLKKSEF